MHNTQYLKHTVTLSEWPGEQPEVVCFTGKEAINHCYSFLVLLASPQLLPNIDALIKSDASLEIAFANKTRTFSGILTSIELLHGVGTTYFYQIKLVPKLYLLHYMHSNQVFLDKSLPDILGQLLTDTGLSTAEYAFRLLNQYPQQSITCQYKETHLHFLRRLTERNGLFFFFEQDGKQQKLIFTDSNSVLREPDGAENLHFSPHTGLEPVGSANAVTSLESAWILPPKQIRLRDYNYEKPELPPEATLPVSPDGQGERYFYGRHVRNNTEARQQAQIKAEELQSHEQVLAFNSFAPFVGSGHLFTLQNHPDAQFNQSYLATRVRHFGNQANKLSASIKDAYTSSAGLLSDTTPDVRFSYSNQITALRADKQYRPPRISRRVPTCGLLYAKIDAAQSGQYAELDEQGRYKVELPFDLSGKPDGKASSWLRMTQPYGGSEHGLHFPVHKGTDVLLFCTDGDPSRPAIQGVAPNPTHMSQVTQSNQTMCNITTSGKNKLHMEDTEGSQGLVASSSTQNTFMRLGAAMDGGGSSGQGIEMGTEGNLYNKVVTNFAETISGNKQQTVSGNSTRIYKNTFAGAVTGAANYSILGTQQDSCEGQRKENYNESFQFFTPAYTSTTGQLLTNTSSTSTETKIIKREFTFECKASWFKKTAIGAKTSTTQWSFGATSVGGVSAKGAEASLVPGIKIALELELLSIKAVCASGYGIRLEFGLSKGAFEALKFDLWIAKDGKETKGTVIKGVDIDVSSFKNKLSSTYKGISALMLRF